MSSTKKIVSPDHIQLSDRTHQKNDNEVSNLQLLNDDEQIHENDLYTLKQEFQKKIEDEAKLKYQELKKMLIQKEQSKEQETFSSKNLGTFEASKLDMKINQSSLMTDIFKRIASCTDYDPNEIDGNVFTQLTMDFKGNALFWDKTNKQLTLKSLTQSDKEPLKKQFPQFQGQQVVKIKISWDGLHYFLGLENGHIHQLKAQQEIPQSRDLQQNNQKVDEQDQKKQFEKMLYVGLLANRLNVHSEISDLCTKKNILISSQKNGNLGLYKKQNLQYTLLDYINIKNAIIDLQISNSEEYLIGVQLIVPKLNNDDDEEVEDKLRKQIIIFKIGRKLEKIEYDFEMIDSQILKLYHFTEIKDTQTLICNSEENSGINVHEILDKTIQLTYFVPNMHLDSIIDFCLLKDNKTMISCGKDKKVRVWDIEGEKELKVLPTQPQGYQFTSIALSKDEKYFITSGKNKFIIWYTKQLNNLCTIKHQELTNQTIEISQDNTILSITDNDTRKFYYWNISEPNKTVSLNFGEDNIIQALITPDDNYLLTENDEGTTALWNLTTREKIQTFCSKVNFKQVFNCTNQQKNNKFLFLLVEESVIMQWNLEEMEEKFRFQLKDEVSQMMLDKFDHILYVATTDHLLTTFALEKNQQMSEFPFLLFPNEGQDNYQPQMAVAENGKNLILSSSDKRYHIIDVSNPISPLLKNKGTIKHDQNITGIQLGLNDKYLIIVDEIKATMFHFPGLQKINVIQTYESDEQFYCYFLKIKYPKFQKKGQYDVFDRLVTYNQLNWKIYDPQNINPISVFDGGQIQIIQRNGQLKKILDQENKILGLDGKLIDKLQGKKEKIVDKNSKQENQAWKSQQIQIKGPLNYLYPLFIKNMLKDPEQSSLYIEALKDNIIEPFNINLLHYFAFANQSKCIDQCFQVGMKYRRDRFDFTPLKYAMIRKSMKSIDQILINAETHHDIVKSIKQNELCTLIQRSADTIVQFLEYACQEIQPSVPIFGILANEPSYFKKKRILINKKKEYKKFTELQRLTEKDLLKQVESNDSEPIILKALIFKYNFDLGSQDSIEFHSSLNKTKNTQVYQAEAIQKILEFKWKQLKYIAQFQFFIMLVYNIILLVHLYVLDNMNIKYTLVGFFVYFLIFQIIQMANKQVISSFLDFWSLLDYAFLAILLAYLIVEILLTDTYSHQQYLLSFLNIISWVREISFLRAFKNTRIFIYLLQKIIYDLEPFMIVMFSVILTSSTTFFILSFGEKVLITPPSAAGRLLEETSLLTQIIEQFSSYFDFPKNLNGFDMLNHFYRVFQYMYGGFNPQYFSTEKFKYDENWNETARVILFVITQFFIFLVMMNIIIAIISDTRTAVISNIDQEDFNQINKMILKYENMFFWKRKSGIAQYLHWFEYPDEVKAIHGGTTDYLIKKLNEPMQELHNNVDLLQIDSSTEKLKTDLIEKQILRIMAGAPNNADNVKKELDSFKYEIQSDLSILRNQLTQDISKQKKGIHKNIRLIEIPNLDLGGGDTRDPIRNVKSRSQAIDILDNILVKDGDHATYNSTENAIHFKLNRHSSNQRFVQFGDDLTTFYASEFGNIIS